MQAAWNPPLTAAQKDQFRSLLRKSVIKLETKYGEVPPHKPKLLVGSGTVRRLTAKLGLVEPTEIAWAWV